MRNLDRNKANLARIADPRGLNESQANQIIANTKPHYHLMGGLHSGEVGPSEMLMELAYRLVAETSPQISQTTSRWPRRGRTGRRCAPWPLVNLSSTSAATNGQRKGQRGPKAHTCENPASAVSCKRG